MLQNAVRLIFNDFARVSGPILVACNETNESLPNLTGSIGTVNNITRYAYQQYLTDTSSMDILAVSKDNKILLIVELKKGRVSVVVWQCPRYISYVKEKLAEENQKARRTIIGFEDDKKI